MNRLTIYIPNYIYKNINSLNSKQEFTDYRVFYYNKLFTLNI